jgi:hypothetical protein
MTINAQEVKNKKCILGFSIGPNFSNLINSEAPHKYYIYGYSFDGSKTVILLGTKETSPAYIDYETGFFKDMLIGVNAGITMEYKFNGRFSLSSGLRFETRGINLRYSNVKDGVIIVQSPLYLGFVGEIHEELRITVQNNYLILPVYIKYYFNKRRNLYFKGGIYSSYLLASKHSHLIEKRGFNDGIEEFKFSFSLENDKDKEKEYTSHFDVGISLGAGYSKKISNKLIFDIDILATFGFVKVDRKFDNYYDEYSFPSGSGFFTVITSENYYGLNSNARNLVLSVLFGIGYLL